MKNNNPKLADKTFIGTGLVIPTIKTTKLPETKRIAYESGITYFYQFDVQNAFDSDTQQSYPKV